MSHTITLISPLLDTLAVHTMADAYKSDTYGTDTSYMAGIHESVRAGFIRKVQRIYTCVQLWYKFVVSKEARNSFNPLAAAVCRSHTHTHISHRFTEYCPSNWQLPLDSSTGCLNQAILSSKLSWTTLPFSTRAWLSPSLWSLWWLVALTWLARPHGITSF